jgi:magnesium chelatase subunit H
MPKSTTVAERSAELLVTIVTLDGHLGGAAERAFRNLRRQAPGLECRLYAAGEWAANPSNLDSCRRDIARSDILIVCMLFMEEHINAVLPALSARRDSCDAILCFMSAGEVMRLTRIGGFSMDGGQRGPLALLKKLRGARSSQSGSSGARQIAMLKKLPRILRFIPGTAQDLRVYFLAMQYWLAGSEENIRNLIAMLASRYAQGPRRALAEQLAVDPPLEYPEVGVYHPRLGDRVAHTREALARVNDQDRPAVGILLMRSYILAGNTAHYDALIEAIESRGLVAIGRWLTPSFPSPGFRWSGDLPTTMPAQRPPCCRSSMCRASLRMRPNSSRSTPGNNRMPACCR